MKLKTLLLGSAATLIAVSGAQAADAVVAEPEPVDYVKVCDMYGAGFFYIPGTETCLKISGEVRVQYEYSVYDSGGYIYDYVTQGLALSDSSDTSLEITTVSVHDHHDSKGTSYWHARVNFDAREETDWGTLRTYIRLEGAGDGQNSAQSSWGALDAYIELGGISTGYRTSRVELTGLPGLMFDGSYFGGGRTMYMDYTYAANGLAVIAGVSLDNEGLARGLGGARTDFGDESVDGYIRFDYSGSMFNIGAVYGHDTSASEGAWGVYGNVTPMDGLLIQGYYNSQSASTQFGGGGDTQKWGIGASYAIMDNVSIAAGYYEIESSGAGAVMDLEGWSLGLDWNVVNNLVVRLGYNHEDMGAYGDVSDFRVRIQSNF